MRCIGEAIKAGRQRSGKASGQKQVARVAGIFEPEQDCGERAAAAGQRQGPARLGLEAGGVGEGAGGGIERGDGFGPAGRGHEPNRNGFG